MNRKSKAEIDEQFATLLAGKPMALVEVFTKGFQASIVSLRDTIPVDTENYYVKNAAIITIANHKKAFKLAQQLDDANFYAAQARREGFGRTNMDYAEWKEAAINAGAVIGMEKI